MNRLPERVCLTYELARDGEEVYCFEPAVVHIAKKFNHPVPGRYKGGYACEEHKEDALKDPHDAHHPLGPCCGMPGSAWIVRENKCRCGELPVEEKAAQRELVGAR